MLSQAVVLCTCLTLTGAGDAQWARGLLHPTPHPPHSESEEAPAQARSPMAPGLLAVASADLAAPACPAGTVPWPGEPCEPLGEAIAAESAWLRAHAFKFDLPNAPTYFDNGVAVPTVRLALAARARYGWAAAVPRAIWRAAVLPYASVNEARTDWRQLMWETLSPLVTGMPNATAPAAAATALNGMLWSALGNLTARRTPIVFKPQQTPLIWDPMSTIVFGFASCTGISITFVDALRTIGIPARLVGTPAWHGVAADGNHNWVEVWLGAGASAPGGAGGADAGWAFIEGAPAGAGETFANPCDKWFCNGAHFNGSVATGTRVYAASYGPPTGVHYPMEWDVGNTGVVGVDRTAYYHKVCGACGAEHAQGAPADDGSGSTSMA